MQQLQPGKELSISKTYKIEQSGGCQGLDIPHLLRPSLINKLYQCKSDFNKGNLYFESSSLLI